MSLRTGARPAVLALLAALALPAAASASTASRTADAWNRLAPSALAPLKGVKLLVAPDRFAAFKLNLRALDGVLAAAPREGTLAARFAPLIVSLPKPDGTLARFRIFSSPVMEAGLAKRRPEIRTFAGQGIDDPTANVRLDSTPLGFHASVFSKDGAWYVDPRYRGDTAHYVSYRRGALAAPSRLPDSVIEDLDEHAAKAAAGAAATEVPATEVPLRTYRLALVTTPSYAENSGAKDGLPANATAAEVNARVTAAKAVMVNRVNQIYEQDFSSRMVLANGTDATNLNTTAAATGANGPCGAAACFTAAQVASCSSGGLTQNSLVAGMLVGARNFDIGHLALGTDGGGVAQLGVVGDTAKARGCTGLARPVGDFFAIDYVAHEMGHEFGGNHTFDGTQGSCLASNRNLTGATAVEPGSGSTVMAYAGICGTDDLQAHTDPYFSHASIAEMGTYIASANANRSSVQQVGLRGFDGADSFRLTYGTQTTAPIVRGGNYSAAGIKAALEAILPSGGTVTVTGFNGAAFGDTGFQVTFAGTLANKGVSLLGLAEPAGVTGVVGETVAGGTTTRGGKTSTATGNHAPNVSTVAGYTIPLRTPFELKATGSDPDGDTLTFLWEQADPGLPALGTGLMDNHRTTGPLFRQFGTAARYADPDDTYEYESPGENLATPDANRSFPDLAQVLADNTNALTGACTPAAVAPVEDEIVDCFSEFLPTASWVGVNGDGVLHFRVTARDHHAATGATAKADTALTLAKGAGPFRVLSPISLPGDNQALQILWDVARTDVLTGTANVRITLSTDGGKTFPIELRDSTPNDGNEPIELPASVNTTKGRIKIEAVGNVFYDVSHADLTLGDE